MIKMHWNHIKFKIYEWLIRPYLKKNNAKLLNIKKNRYIDVYIPNVGVIELRVPKREYII